MTSHANQAQTKRQDRPLLPSRFHEDNKQTNADPRGEGVTEVSGDVCVPQGVKRKHIGVGKAGAFVLGRLARAHSKQSVATGL